LKDRSTHQSKPVTLTDSDIVSTPSVSRRSLLGTLGLGAGAALAASVVAMTPSEAADKAKKAPPKRKPAKKAAPKKESDSD
jgi:hypothetical protein